MSEGNPNKRYYVQLPGYQQGEIWDEDKYNRNKDKLFTDHKDAIVLETAPMDKSAQIGENDSYTVHLPGFPEAEVWDGAKLARNRDKLLKQHPDAEITKTTPIDYWGGKLGEIHNRIDALQAELGKLPAEPDMADLRNMDDDDLVKEAVRTSGKDKPGLARRSEINRELDQLYREREANPSWQKYWETQRKELDDYSAGVEQMQKQLKDENKESEEHLRKSRIFMGGGPANMGLAAVEIQKSDPEYISNKESLAAAKLYLEDAKKIVDAPARYGEEGGAMKDFWQGVVDGAPEALSIVQLGRAGLNMHLVDAVKKIQEHEASGKETNIVDFSKSDAFNSLGYLNDGEKALVKAFVKKAEVEAGRSGLISRSYQAGQGAIQSAGYMADFAVMGGIGEKAAQSVAGNLVKSAGRNELAKIGAETLYGTTKALAMTPFMPSTYANFVNNILQFDDAKAIDLSGKAMLQAAGDVLIENISETVGSKPLELIGLPLSKVKFPDWAKALRNSPVAQTMKQAGYNGFFEEMFEEWTGNTLRVMTGVDKNALKDFATIDQQLITAGSFAPMFLMGAPVSAVQYGAASRAMKKAGVSLDEIIGTLNADDNVKDAIRNLAKDTSAATPEELAHHMTDVYKQIVDNGGNAEDAYRAVLNYTEAVSNYNVMDGMFEEQKDIDRSRRLLEMDSQMGNENWHHFGSNGESFVRVLTDGQGNERFVLAQENGAVSLVDREGNKSIMTEDEIAQGVQDGTLSDSGEMYLFDFLDKQTEAKKKANEQVRVEQEAKEAATELMSRLQPQMQINFGTVENPQVGTILQNVAGRVVVQKADGTTQDYAPEELAPYLGIDIMPKSDEQITQQEIDRLEQEKAKRELGNGYRGLQITNPGDGKQYTLVGVTRGQSGVYSQDGTLVNSIPYDVQVTDENGRSLTIAMDEASYDKMLESIAASLTQSVTTTSTAEENAAAQKQANEQSAVEDNIPRDFRGNPLPMRLNKQTGQQVVAETTLWNNDPEAWAAYNDTNPNRKVTSKERLEFNVKELAKEIEKDDKSVQKAALKGIDEDEMDKMEDALNKKRERLDLLNSILAKYSLPVEASQTFAGEQRKAVAEQTIQEQQAGFPGIQQKWNTSAKSVGAPDEIRLANGETITGHYVLTEAAAPTPSHNPAGQFKMSDGFPVDEKGKTVNDRDYEHDEAAQKAVVDKASAYDQRALQTPVIVSSDGVVLSGNDRTMASQLAAQQGTDKAYVDYLSKYSQKYGFTPEQVGQFRNPRVVFVPDEAMPYDAATFAKFNADEKKTQNKTEKAVKAGKTISADALGKLAALINGYDDINALYNDKDGVNGLLAVMLADGIITQEQVASLKDGDLLSGAGMDMLESTLIGASLEEEAVRLAMADRSLRKPIVTAIAQIIANNTIEGYTLRTELTDAIVLIANGKSVGEIKFGESVQDYIRQQHIFMDDVVASATVQMLADAINSRKTSFLKNVLSLYNRDAVEAANGQMSLLTNDVPTRDAILRDILEYLGYDARIIFDTSEREENQRAAAEADQTGNEPEKVEAGPAVQGGAGGPVTSKAQFDREEVAARLEEGNVGEYNLADYMTDDEVAEFLKLYEAFQPANDALGEAYNRLDKDLRSSDKKVKKAAQAEIARLEQAQVDAFAPVQEFVDSLIEKYGEDIAEEQEMYEEEIDEELDEFGETEPVEEEVEEPELPKPAKKSGKKSTKKGKKEKGKGKAKKGEKVIPLLTGTTDDKVLSAVEYTSDELEELIYGASLFGDYTSKKTGEKIEIVYTDDSHPVYHDHQIRFWTWQKGAEYGAHRESVTTADYMMRYLKANGFKLTNPTAKKNKFGYWVNKHGVIVNPIRVELPSVHKGWAQMNYVSFAQNDKGKWTTGASFHTATGGYSGPVSGGNSKEGFDTKTEAIKYLLDSAEKYLRQNYKGDGKSKTYEQRDLENLIRTLKTKTLPQALLEEGIVDEVQRVQLDDTDYGSAVQGDLFGAVEPAGTIEEPTAVAEKPKKATAKKKSKKAAAEESGQLAGFEGPAKSVEPAKKSVDVDEDEEKEPAFTIEDEEGTPGNFHWISERVCTNPQIIVLPGADRLGVVSKVALAEKEGKWYQNTFVTGDGGKGSQWGSVIPTFKGSYIPYPSRSEAVKGAIEYMRFLVNDRGRKSSASYGETFNETKGLIDYLVKMELPKEEEGKKIDRDDAVSRIKDALKTNNPARVVRTLEAVQDSFEQFDKSVIQTILSDFRKRGVTKESKDILVKSAQAFYDYLTGVSETPTLQTETAPAEPAAPVQAEPKAEAPAYGSQNTIITTDKYEELKKRMKEKLGQLNAGFDPEVFFIGAQMAAYHVEAGARKFIDFAQRMIGDLGDAIRPYLKAIYNGARDLPGMEAFKKEMDSAADVDGIDVDSIGIEQPQVEQEQEPVAEQKNPSWMEKNTPTTIQGFDGLTDYDIYNACDEYIEGVIRDSQLNIAQVDMVAIGSRAFGTAREDSDLDILVEYKGDVKEDAVFNALNEEPFELLGIKVDFFPIRAEQSGTLLQWLESHDDGRPVAKEEPAQAEEKLNVGDMVVLKNKPKGFDGTLKVVSVNSNGTYDLEYNPTGFLPVTRMGEPAENVIPVVRHHQETVAQPVKIENKETPSETAPAEDIAVNWANEYFGEGLLNNDLSDEDKQKAISIFNALWNGNGHGNGYVDNKKAREYAADEYGVSDDYQRFMRRMGDHLLFVNGQDVYQLDIDYAPAGGKSHLVAHRFYVVDWEAQRRMDEMIAKGSPRYYFEQGSSESPKDIPNNTTGPSGQTIGELGKYTHTKTGKEMSIVRLTGERVSSDEFKKLKARAKEYGGYWSSYGSSKGFLFDTEEDAIKFNTLTTTEDVSENTDQQTAADTAIIVSQAASLEKQAESLVKPAEQAEPVDERKVNRTIQRIDDALERIDDQLALLGYYEADTSDEDSFHESYGYMKSAEKKAVKDADKLAKKLAADLGLEVGKKRLASANIAPAGGDITFRLPLNEGREMYVDISLMPDGMNAGGYYGDNLVVDGVMGKNMAIMFRIENPALSGQNRFEGSNHYAPANVSYKELLKAIRFQASKYLPEAPVPTEGPVDILQVVKEQAEKNQKAGKSQKKSVSSQQDGDALLGSLFDTLDEAEDDGAVVEESPAPAARVKPTEMNGYKVGEKVNYTPSQGDRKPQTATIYDFEYDGRPVLDAGLAPILYEVVDWEQISKIEQEPVNDTNDGVQRVYEQRSEGLPAEGVQPGGREAETTAGTGAEAGQESGGTDTGRTGAGQPADSDTRHRPANAVKHNTRNNRVAKGEVVFPKTPAARYKANIAAIRLLKELQDSDKLATKEQMAVLRQYTGWGGLGGYFNNQYSPEYRELKSLLTDEEMQTAEMSINTAYYTPTEIIDSMWEVAKRLGFEGGTVLEGSAGIGNILASMPKSMSEASEITAVELDNLTGGILEKLYPDANVLIKGFEEADIPNNSVDLAITNVPFGNDISVYDAKEKDLTRKFGGKIHDFCIAKNVRKLREGGLGIFISTRGTLDGSSKALRQWIVNEGNADVIGAFRLNNATFEGTAATSDIIVIRKRVNGKVSPDAINVTDTEITRREDFELDKTEWNPKTRSYERVKGKAAMEINTYFVEHPENMGGEMGFGFEHKDSYRPGSTGLWPTEKIDQTKRLNKWAKQFKASDEVPVAPQATEQTAHEDTNAVKEGQLVANSKGEICISRSGKAIPLGVNAQKIKGKYTKAQALADYDALKTAIDEALQYQLNNESDAGLKPLIDKLNRAYDNFVRKYGNLNKNVAISFLRNDVDFAATAAVEDYKETKDIHGKVKATAKKTSIFSGRVLGAKRIPTPTTAKDGVIASINMFGRIDVPFIADALKKDENAVRDEILSSGLGFENPLTGEVEVEYEYLSGNVREKLEYAREHNEGGKYDKNIEALQKVVPADIPAHLIEFSLGSDWLPVELYAKYAAEKFDINEDKFMLSNLGGTWVVSDNEWEFAANNEKNRAAGVHSEALRMDKKGHELMIAAMNNTSVVFSKTYKDYDGTTHTEHDKVATQNATAKMSEMRDDFKEWCRAKMLETPELAERIGKTYNDTFNAIVPKEITDTFVPAHFEGQVLEMGGKPFHLYPHQAKAAIRATTEPLMMAHEVGAGKTFTLITSAMEMRRLGTAKKPMIVVQNSTLGQFVSSAKELYPNAKVLTISESDRTVEGRSAFYAKIKYNDWDIIIVPQSVFEMMPDSEERQRSFIQEKIDEKKFILAQAKEAKNNNEAKRLEKELADLEYEYQYGEKPPKKGGKRDAKKEAEAVANATAKAKKQLDRRTDEVSDFDDMGIDALLVDEAHSYKHLGFSTAMQRGVKGVDATGSKKAAGVYLKTRAVFDKVGWKNVVFATGTPISNTAAEIWTFMKYLMPADMMKQNHIYYFDDFVRNFGNISQSLEFTTSGKFKENTRFAAYTNLPELIRIWSSVTDTVLTKDAVAAANAEGVTQTLEDKLPKMVDWTDDKGVEHVNQARDIYLPQSPSLVDIMNAIRAKLEWYENLSGKEKKENSYIPLTMFGLAKMAAIDPRLVDRNAIDEPNSKTNMAVKETLKALEDSKDYKGTCALFSDNFRRWDDVNGKRVEGFNIFEEIKRKLVQAGVPEEQIVIMKSGMTTAAKEKIFARVNAGDVRVIMGTTATLGTGVNIQERLFFEAHIDAPNRPMDYTQRTGRILRQGNLHKEWGVPVRVVRFGVEDSLDVTAYQRLSTKSKFINSVMDGKPLIANGMDNRVLEEEEDGEFDNPVAVLSGSEYALLKSQAERELRKIRNKKEQHKQDQIYIERTLKENEKRIAYNETLIEEDKLHLSGTKKAFPDGNVKEITIEGRKVKATEKERINETIKEKITSPVRELVERHRKDPAFSFKVLRYNMAFDGVPVEVGVVIERGNFYDENKGSFQTVMRTSLSYSCPKFGIESRIVRGGYNGMKDLVADFSEKIASGNYYEVAIRNLENTNARLESDNALMSERRGKPFADEDKLKKQEEVVKDYTEKMKAEMAEKEAKYAEIAKNATTSFNLDDVDVEDEDDGDESVHNRDTEEDSGERIDLGNPFEVARVSAAIGRLAKRLGVKVNIERGDPNGSKGYYVEGQDSVTINIARAESLSDAIDTLLHEAVGHYGLRQLFGNEHALRRFINDMLRNAPEQILNEIAGLAAENGWDMDYAAEEYLAEMAVKVNKNRAERSLWRKIVDAINDFISTLVGAPVRVNETSVANMFNEVGLENLMRRSFTSLEDNARRNDPVQGENESNKAFAERCVDEIGKRGYNMIAKGKFFYDAKEDSPAGDYNRDMDFIRIFARDGFLYGDYEDIFFHENLHAFLEKNGYDGNSKPVKDFIDFCRALLPEAMKEKEDFVESTKDYPDSEKTEEVFVLSVVDMMREGSPSIVLPRTTHAFRSLITEYFKQIGYEIDREATSRTPNRVEDGQQEVRVSDTRMRTGEEVRPAGRSEGEGESELGGIDSPRIHYRVRTKPAPKNTDIGYKVFYQGKDGKLYPPMVNPTGEATPVGVWLDAEEGTLAGTSKTGRKKVKAGGKGTQGGGGTLSYRPGWHLGEIPYALQFNRGEKVDNPLGITNKQGEIIKVGKYFPKNFVWGEVEYAKDVDYQDEAMSYGYNKNGNFEHAKAGLPRIPVDGYYKYRTNANPATDPWIITGAMKVNRILTDEEVDKLVRDAGREPQEREPVVSRNRIGYHGSIADFDQFDSSHALEGEGYAAHGFGHYIALGRDTSVGYAWGNAFDYADRNGLISPEIADILRNDSFEDYDTMVERYDYLLENRKKELANELEEARNDKPVDMSIVRTLEAENELVQGYRPLSEVFAGMRNIYTVEIPEDTGDNYIDEMKTLSKDGRRRIAAVIRDIDEAKLDRTLHGPNWLPNGFKTLANVIEREQYAGLEIRQRLEDALGNTNQARKETAEILRKAGFVGMTYDGRRDGPCVVIFDSKDLNIVNHERFRRAGMEMFISNAEAAVNSITMDKATPQQWLKMIDGKGGLKAGEDKWIGLSEWLKAHEGKTKTLTKEEVLNYIDQNKIQIQETDYFEQGDPAAMEQMHPGFSEAFWLEEDFHGEPYIDGIDNLKVAVDMFNREVPDMHIDYNDGDVSDEDYDKLYDFGNDILKDQHKIDNTRLRYTTEGLVNNREIALTVPTIAPWKTDDRVHFGDAGLGRAVAWARFGDAIFKEEANRPTDEDKAELARLDKVVSDKFNDYAYDSTNQDKWKEYEKARDERDEFAGRTRARGLSQNKKVLFIDEIQSKRHQDAREYGYKSVTEKEIQNGVDERNKAWSKYTDAKKAIDDYLVSIFGDKYNVEEGLLPKEYYDANPPTDEQNMRIAELNYAAKEAYNEWQRAQDVVDANLKEQGDGMKVPSAPFEKSWHELTMKRMLRYAAENGYDYVAWTTGEQQAQRYDIGNVIGSIDVSRWGEDVNGYYLGEEGEDKNLRGVLLNVVGGSSNANNDNIELVVNREGKVVEAPFYKDFVNKPLSEIVGKNLAQKIVATEGRDKIDSEQLRLGGEGMKGFYDDILPRFMNKYGKKWGVHVEDIFLPKLIAESGEKGIVAHAVPVTPEMKESVMQGQLMFRQGEVSEPSPVSYKESMGAKRLAVNETANKCGIDIEFKPSSEMQFLGKPLAGRWLNGKMYICLEHCRDNDDAVRTVLHEGVGHNGLRRLIGDENMTDFCLEMFGKLPEDARRAIASDAVSKYGGDLAESVEEYLAERAEVMDFENGDYERNFWDIVRDALRRVLAKVGINIPLSRRDVRWLMWQSYNANKQSDILNEAKRQVVANRLGFTLTQQADKAEAVQIARNRIAEQVLAPAARIYNKDVVYWLNRLHETWVDKDNAVHALVNAIEKATGRKAKSFEDIRLALNQQSSKGLAAIEKFERENYEPMKAAIKSLMQEKGIDLKDVERYVMIKHGLERNEVFAQRDAREYYQDIHDRAVKIVKEADNMDEDRKKELVKKLDANLQKHLADIENKTDRKYKQLRKQDYGGLTAMYSEWDDIEPFMEGVESEEEYKARVLRARHPKYTYIDEDGREQVDMVATEEAAMNEVADFERGHDAAVDELWKRINNATKATLKHQYDANMMSREQYIHVRDMFRYYVPLRGFSENTAEDMYDYYRSDQRNDFTPPLLKAKGRTTESESPFGYIGSMASSGIAADMKNETKLALYYFVNNRANNDLVTISEVWYRNTGVDEFGRRIFTPVYPPINEDLSNEDAKRAYEEWENQMQEEAKAGFAFKGGRKLNLHNSVIHIDNSQKTSHIIKFKVGGKDMMMYINGNPRAAQAINNELNVEMSADYQRFFGKILRWFSGINTSYNPEFWLSNAQRDALFALMAVSVKEDSEYGRAFRKNFGSLLASTLTPGRKGGAYSLKKKLDSGTLGDEKLDRLYKEFVENGGVTGYTTLKNNEEWELELRKYTGQEKKAVAAVKSAFDAVQGFGEAIEQMTRFAAYVTSRDMGKDIKDAVNDAKELTVNFNRKGSGKAISFKEAERLRTKDGKKLTPVQRAFVVAASWLPVYGRRFIMFFNASTQGLNAMYKLFKKDGKKMAAWTAGYFALGVMQALIHALLDDDDDYLDIPDYERRNNLLLGGKGAYFKWALPQEARVFYAMGDMVVNHAMGREPHKSIAGEVLASLSDIAPLNPSGGLAALAPSALTPVVEVALNRDYKGAKIFNDLRYLSDEERKRTPAYQRAYQGTGKVYILLSQFANWLSGGDYADAGWLNINPAAVEHIMKGATGGAGTTLGKLYRGTVGQVLGEDFTVRNTPFLSRILTINDDRYRNAHTTELFDYYKAEAEHTKKLINTYRKNGDDRKLERLVEGKDYEIMTIYDSYRKMLQWYNDELKETTDKKERKALMREQDAVRKEMIQEISNIGHND